MKSLVNATLHQNIRKLLKKKHNSLENSGDDVDIQTSKDLN